VESGGCYSSKSAYRAYFQGSVTFEPWRRYRNLGLQKSVRSFFGWLFPIGAGLPIDLKKEGYLIQISALYVTKRMRQCNTCWFLVWLLDSATLYVTKKVKREYKKGVNSLIILGAWIIWKHRNACVFEGLAPSVTTIHHVHGPVCPVPGSNPTQPISNLVGRFRNRRVGWFPWFNWGASKVVMAARLCDPSAFETRLRTSAPLEDRYCTRYLDIPCGSGDGNDGLLRIP
jgi:hypothetical protein